MYIINNTCIYVYIYIRKYGAVYTHIPGSHEEATTASHATESFKFIKVTLSNCNITFHKENV